VKNVGVGNYWMENNILNAKNMIFKLFCLKCQHW